MRTLITAVVLFGMYVPAHAQRGIIVDYAESPAATEAELFRRAVAAVRGTVESRRLDKSSAGRIGSIYRVRLLEVFKSDSQFAAGQVVDVHRHGGFGGTNV